MIENKFQEVALKNEIQNAYQFQKLSRLPPAMAARIYKSNWKRIDIKTLNLICNLFNCMPNDILEFTPDPDE